MSGATTQDRQVQETIYPERKSPQVFALGGKNFFVRPMVYRWQALFWAAAMPIIEAGEGAVETIMGRARTRFSRPGDSTVVSLVWQAEVDSVVALGQAAAIILASQIAGAEKRPAEAVQEQLDWLCDSSNVDEMRALVNAQMIEEKLVQHVGESLPAKLLEELGRLVGQKEAMEKPASTSSLPTSPKTLNGDGA